MLIRNIHIISFGMLYDRHIRFGDGLNVIEGENETGKSTVGAFVKFMFYGLDKAEGTNTSAGECPAVPVRC